eukprot:5751313-Heterocapsa_arctica.AAC.1
MQTLPLAAECLLQHQGGSHRTSFPRGPPRPRASEPTTPSRQRTQERPRHPRSEQTSRHRSPALAA